MVLQKLGNDLVGRLWRNSNVAAGTHLGAQANIEQAQKMIDLRHGRNRGFSATTTGSLLNGDGGRDAVNGINIRLAGRLHNTASVGIQRFEIAPLPFVEKNIEGQGRLAGARDTGNHSKRTVWNTDFNIF